MMISLVVVLVVERYPGGKDPYCAWCDKVRSLSMIDSALRSVHLSKETNSSEFQL